jgi:hypothetical protein
LLQLLPATFDVPYSHGNLSNGFGQAMTVLFFAWWAGATPGGWVVGAVTFVLAGLGHLSSLIVLLALAAGLVLVRRKTILADRPRRTALALGVIATGLYYGSFGSLVADQVPRLLEGPGRGRASPGMIALLGLQVERVVDQWGWPALILGLVGALFARPRGEPLEADRRVRNGLDRDLAAFWGAGLVLAAAALASPLEVRYLYALTLPLALASAAGATFLWDGGAVRRTVAGVALAAQVVLAARGLVEAVLYRYRP